MKLKATENGTDVWEVLYPTDDKIRIAKTRGEVYTLLRAALMVLGSLEDVKINRVTDMEYITEGD